LLSLDFVAKRYGRLPSEVLESGSSIDLQIANLAVQYENYLHKKHSDQANGKVTPNLSQEEMLSMLSAVRNRKDGNKKNQ
jgi:hypothetical protein